VRQLVEEALARRAADAAAVPGPLPADSGPASPGAALDTPFALPAVLPDAFAPPPPPGGDAAQALPPADAASPAAATARELSEEELLRLEKVVLGTVQAGLAESDSVLVRTRGETFVQRVGAILDGLWNMLLGRNRTW
jgi:hypothetical protein